MPQPQSLRVGGLGSRLAGTEALTRKISCLLERVPSGAPCGELVGEDPLSARKAVLREQVRGRHLARLSRLERELEGLETQYLDEEDPNKLDELDREMTRVKTEKWQVEEEVHMEVEEMLDQESLATIGEESAREKLAAELKEMLRKVAKCNHWAIETQRFVFFEAIVDRKTRLSPPRVVVRATRLWDFRYSLWEADSMELRMSAMEVLFEACQQAKQEGQPLPEVDPDPFLPREVLIGKAVIFLSPLAYGMPVNHSTDPSDDPSVEVTPETSKLNVARRNPRPCRLWLSIDVHADTNSTDSSSSSAKSGAPLLGGSEGSESGRILRLDRELRELEMQSLESDDDLLLKIGTPLHLKVMLKEVHDLPEEFDHQIYCEFTFLHSHVVSEPKDAKDRTAVTWDRVFELDTLLTEEVLDYFNEESVEVKVYGSSHKQPLRDEYLKSPASYMSDRQPPAPAS